MARRQWSVRYTAAVAVETIILLLSLGLVSGLLGGMLGIGGSIIIIPALTVILGPNQHLYQAAAMIVNVVVAVPATVRHVRASAVPLGAVARMLPFGVAMILAGVAASDVMDGRVLQRCFGGFLAYVVFVNIRRMLRRGAAAEETNPSVTWPRCGIVGSIVGFMAGLLGIGGGVVAVPLLQRVCRLPIRQCIAGSSAVMCVTAVVGAIRKNGSLSTHIDLQGVEGAFHEPTAGLMIAILLAPTALAGGFLGAGLTHRLPLKWIRVAFVSLLVIASIRMLAG